MLSWNVAKGLVKHKSEILNFLNEQKAGVAFLIEVDRSQLEMETQQFPGYKTIVQKNENQSDKARIIALIDNNLEYKVREDLMVNNLPTIWIELVRENMSNVIIGGIYREWGANQEPNLTKIISQLHKASSDGLPILLQGDINLCMQDWNSHDYKHSDHSDRWKSALAATGLSWEDLGVTFESFYRLQNGEKKRSALDHIYHTQHDIFDGFEKFGPRFSDHWSIKCNVNAPKRAKPSETFILRRSWKNFDQSSYLHDLVNRPWDKVLDPKKSVHEQAEAFQDIMKSTLDDHAPLGKFKIRPHFVKGLSEKTKKLIRDREKARVAGNKPGLSANERLILREKYKRARNAVTSRIRREAKIATLNSIKESGNPSQYWKAASAVTKPKSKAGMELEENGEKITDAKKLANIINMFFKTKIVDIEGDIPIVDIDPTEKLKEKLEGKNLKFNLPPVTENQVMKAIKCLKPKTSSGMDFVPPTILKMAADIIILPLTFIINNSFECGEFPSPWKVAKVSPIWKNKGSKLDKTMYRPVSNLISVSKVIELIVNKKVLNFFESNNLFPNSQHGFRQKRSTFSAVAAMHEQWIENRENRKHQALAFLDLSAAFDTLSKEVFCKKLEVYGFDNNSVNWFRSYLSERTQYVMIGSEISNPITLDLGSPQGAIMSPTIFLILVADIEQWAEGAKLCGYADDTSCTVVETNLDDLKKKCEENVNNLLTFMAVNKLAANDDKTHILVSKCGESLRDLSFNIGNAVKPIKESTSEKLLGIWVSNDLKWNTHLEKLKKKLLVSLFTLRQVEQSIPKSLLKKVAEGIFLSNLRYGLGIFCPVRIKDNDPDPVCLDGINVVFNDCMRLLCCSKRSDHKSREEMLNELKWLSVNQLNAEVRLLEVWKSLNEDYCLSDMFKKVESKTRRTGKNSVRVPKVVLSRLRDNSFKYPSCKLWNLAPIEVTTAPTLAKAKDEIRKFVKSLPK